MAVQRAKHSAGAGMRRGIKAVKEKLVSQRVIYAPVCVEKDDRVVRRLEMTKWRKEKKVREQLRRIEGQNNRQRAYVW